MPRSRSHERNGGGTAPNQPAGGRRSTRFGGASGSGTLYTVDEKGVLTPIRVRTGLTDGSVTEIRGRDLKEGMKVVAGTAQPKVRVREVSDDDGHPHAGAHQDVLQRHQ